MFNIKFHTGILVLFFLTAFSFSIKSQYKKDSLFAEWKNPLLHDTSRLNSLDRMCERFYAQSDPDSCIYFSELAYNFAKTRNLKKYMGKALAQKGNGYKTKGDNAKNLECSIQALQLCREAGFEKGVAVATMRIGNCYMNSEDYSNAAQYLFESLKLFTKLKNESSQSLAMTNIAKIYRYAGYPDSSLNILKRCLSIQTRLKNKKLMANIYSQMADISYYLSKPDDVIRYEGEAIKIWEELKFKNSLATSYIILSKGHQSKKNSTLALEYIQKALAISRQLGDSTGVAYAYVNLGVFYYNIGNTPKAIEFLNPALKMYKDREKNYVTEDVVHMLTRFNMEQKNYKEAFKMYELQDEYKNRNRKLNAKNALDREQMKLDLEKKGLVVKTELEKKLSETQLEAEQKDFRKNIWLLSGGFLLILLSLSAYFIYHNFKQKNIIADQKNNLLKQQLLVSQMNPHFIFNSLNAIQNFIFKQDSHNAGIYLKKFSELVRMILNFSTRDLISLEDEINFLQSYLELQKLRFNNKLNYELKIDPELEKEIVMIPPMLAQPFIENSIEHGIFYKNGQGFLSIKISLKKDTLLYEIEDDGIGIGESLKLKKDLSKKHKSLAIQITKERIETMNAQNHTDFEIEIKDKALLQKETSGVYVKFTTPYLTL